MIFKPSRIGLNVALVVALAGCDLEPDPVVTTRVVPASQLVVLQGQRVPASEVYWLFTSHPVAAVGNFSSLTWETAEFVPVVAGEYIVDRWAVSGPAGVWTDRFVINATLQTTAGQRQRRDAR